MRYVKGSALIALVASIAVLSASRIAWVASTNLDTQMWMLSSLLWLVLVAGTRFDLRRGILAFACCAVVVLPLHDVFSDDAQRYLWDGIVVASGDSPYASSPLREPLIQHRTILLDGTTLPDDMPYASMRTIYPPGMQLVAGALVSVVGAQSRVAFEFGWWLVVVAALALALRSAEPHDRTWITLACMSPIVLIHGLGDVHSDILMAALALLGVIAVKRDRWIIASVVLALAISIKYIPLLLLPALLRGRTRHEKMLVIAIVCAVVGATYLPFLLAQGSVVGSLPIFAAHWQANSLLYTVFTWVHASLFTPERIRIITALVAVSLTIRIWWRYRTQPIIAAMMTYIAVLLCSPVVHAWYLALPVVLIPFAPLRSTITWAATMSVYGIFYATYKGDGVWFEHPVALAIEFVPVWIAFARDIQCGPLLLRDQERARSTALA